MIAVLLSTFAWFIAASVLFFNPIVDRQYAKNDRHPSVQILPKTPATIVKILLVVFLQCLLWYGVYLLVVEALPVDPLMRGLYFGLLLSVVKVIPRDLDRILLTTYPSSRMFIEFVIGCICSFVVGLTFSYSG